METAKDELDAWQARVSDVGGRVVREALSRGTAQAGRAGALVAATEATALLGRRSARLLAGEAAVTAAVLNAVLPRLLGEAPTAASDLLVQQFPVLVHGFAGELADTAGLSAAVRLDAELPAASARPARGGCSVVQALPATVRRLPELDAPAAVRVAASAVLAAGDELHRRMAEVRSEREPVAATLAEAYGTLYAAAAALHLWAEHTGSAGFAEGPLWQDAGWLHAALAELADRLTALLGLPGPASDDIAEAYGKLLATAAEARSPLTPFGSAAAAVEQPAAAEEDRDV